MEIVTLPIEALTPDPHNAKEHPAEQIEQIKASIQQFGNADPIGIWGDKNLVVEGHGRLIALKELGYTEAECIRLDWLTDEERRAYALAHNQTTLTSGFIPEALDEALASIHGIDMTAFGFEGKTDEEQIELEKEEAKRRLKDFFLFPPFSVLDARDGNWQARKDDWKKIIGNASETRDEGSQKTYTLPDYMPSINGDTSNFDPVLAEIMIRWFNKKGGKILDPFGGEQTKGVVAGELGFPYFAVEFRQDQVDLNKRKTAAYSDVHYYCGDSNNIDEIIEERDFDLCFTSPPYYDLETYSKEDMSALGTYEEFMAQYKNIFAKCYDMLAENAFLVIKVGEIRDKKTGIYRSFVPDNIRIMTEIGFHYYNELVLVTMVGTASLRAFRYMNSRKVAKTHQNVLVFYKGNPETSHEPVLVFYKGDPKDIPKIYEAFEEDSLIVEEEED